MNILSVAPAWIGDAIMSEPLYRQLRLQCPEAKLDVLAPAWSAPVHERMDGVHTVIENPFAHGELNLSGRWKLAQTLKKRHYDLAIVLPNSLKSALIPFFANIPKRRGWRGEMRYGLLNDLRILDKSALPLMVERFLALAFLPNTPLNHEDYVPKLTILPEHKAKSLARHQLTLSRPVVALCPGAEFGEAKRWPAVKFAEFAQKCLEYSAQIWIFGSHKDAALAQEIIENIPTHLSRHVVFNLCGKTHLGEALDLLSCATFAVCNDSGLMHMACAVDIPVLAIYGSSSPNFTPPLSSRAHIISLGLKCSPCFQRSCPLKHLGCLERLSSDYVFQYANQFFNANG